MKLFVGVLIALVSVGSVASAMPIEKIEIDPATTLQPGNPTSRTIYLNRCAGGGCTITRGQESAVNNTSSIQINGSANYDPFPYGDTAWNALVQCVREVYAPFDVQIVDQRPASGTYWMHIVGGYATDFGYPQDSGTLGVSPYGFGCPAPLLNNTVTFTFAGDSPNNTNYLCHIVAQETAHSFGLDHEALALDVMTYIGLGDTTPDRYTFKNQQGGCGALQPDDDGCSDSCRQMSGIYYQNSYASIMSLFGPAGPSPPMITISNPTQNQRVSAGFQVIANITDGNGVQSATLQIDNQNIQTIMTPPYIFSTPEDIAEGTHTVTVRATDTAGTQGSASVSVVIGPPCETPGDCQDAGDGWTCVGGRCVPGEGEPGGLGTDCENNSDCFSGNCQADSEGNAYCVEACDPDGDDCPGGYGCIASGDSGVCWPGAGGGGGCLSADTDTPTLPIALGITLGALVLRRRRRT